MKSHDTVYWNDANNVIKGIMSLFYQFILQNKTILGLKINPLICKH